MKTGSLVLGGIAAYLGVGVFVAASVAKKNGCPAFSLKAVQTTVKQPDGSSIVTTCPSILATAFNAATWPLAVFGFHK